MSLPRIILLGGGGHCRACIDVIEATGKFSVAGVVDQSGSSVLGYPCLGSDEDLPQLRQNYDYAMVTVGQIKTAAIRVRLFERLQELGFQLPVIVSPMAHVSPHAHLHEGTIAMHFSCVNAGASVGENCILNTGSLIEHDSQIGDHCHVSTKAVVNGGVTVGACSFLGSGSVVVQNIHLNDDSFIRANSLVAHSS